MNDYMYLSGKMSGIPEYNFPAFRRKAEELRRLGHKVWNPAEHNPKRCHTWADFIRDDISVLNKRCNSIYMFGKWYRSHGALVELLSAHRLGLRIEIEQWWLCWLAWLLNTTRNPFKGE